MPLCIVINIHRFAKSSFDFEQDQAPNSATCARCIRQRNDAFLIKSEASTMALQTSTSASMDATPGMWVLGVIVCKMSLEEMFTHRTCRCTLKWPILLKEMLVWHLN